MFLVGQKVVCVDGVFPAGIDKLYVALPKEGQTYTIRGMAPGIEVDNKTDAIAVYLREIHNPRSKTPPHRERGFKAERFRPLEELTTEEILALSKPALVPAHEEIRQDREVWDD